VSIINRIRQYLTESWSELKKVSWPTRIQVRNLTVLVIAISFAVGVYIAIFDAIFGRVIEFVATL
jgi:preprotein translocase subunit SecE